jgi:hypothetical protein
MVGVFVSIPLSYLIHTSSSHPVRMEIISLHYHTMALFSILVQWHGLQPDDEGFVHLSIAEFSLQTRTIGY